MEASLGGNQGITEESIGRMTRGELDESLVCLVKEGLLHGAVPETVDAVHVRGEVHLVEPALQPRHELRFLHGDELSGRSRQAEYGSRRNEGVGVVHPSEGGQGFYRAELRVGGHGEGDVMVLGAKLVVLRLGDGDDNAVGEKLDVLPLEKIARVEFPPRLRHHIR